MMADKTRKSDRSDKHRRDVPGAWPKEPKQKSQKRPKRSIEEKLARYENHAEGYEFVPALMHLLDRYVSRPPDGTRTPLDDRMAKALDEAKARKIVERAVKAHKAIPLEIRRRAFSPKYLSLPLEQPITEEEAAS